MEVVVKEITIIKLSGEISIKITSEEAVSKVVDLIIDISHYHRFLDKRSTIYIGNLDAG
jgi:hypothetical protein